MTPRGFVRRVLHGAARLAVSLLTRTEIHGREHIPRTGACILAGNHDAAIEIVLMLAVSPRPPVFLGTGDVPLDRSFRLLGHLYGFIPYRRGSMDRGGLDQARAALRTSQPLGVFPEGGIWQAGAKDTRRGVAWLSDREGVPVAPMGFRGIVGALPQVFALRRPRLAVHVGRPIPPPSPAAGPPRERQQALAQEIEGTIRRLAGQTRAPAVPEPAGLLVRTGRPGEPAAEARWTDPEGRALAHFLATSLLRNVFIENLHRHVHALEPGRGPFPLAQALRAVRILRGYFRLRNPGFLAYRFGEAEAARIVSCLARLQRDFEQLEQDELLGRGRGEPALPGVSIELLRAPEEP
ncbi:MAG: 1-acyl-sn-glycerol-3-phosphate acyltransferase [Spirochaetales bacterium]|nr:1-acyl-sn-glycerol-3-phosphate acyltransferase [Spirochaetales bacterium]